jgi:hypothetical protein
MNTTASVLSALVLLAGLSGCDTLNWQQYRVTGVAAGSADESRIRSVVSAVASLSGMPPGEAKANKDRTFISFTRVQPPDPPINLAARYEGSDVLIDLSSVFGPRIPGFRQIGSRLEHELRIEFGNRCTHEAYRVQ